MMPSTVPTIPARPSQMSRGAAYPLGSKTFHSGGPACPSARVLGLELPLLMSGIEGQKLLSFLVWLFQTSLKGTFSDVGFFDKMFLIINILSHVHLFFSFNFPCFLLGRGSASV